jgi:hypothetical protein
VYVADQMAVRQLRVRKAQDAYAAALAAERDAQVRYNEACVAYEAARDAQSTGERTWRRAERGREHAKRRLDDAILGKPPQPEYCCACDDMHLASEPC